ncbi:nicotinate-nucleotide--dimethylbenzimidazole phosphoribosyltransferase [Reichenbachiella sp. 5M10]|uniref:nicotinate-nucleotide--dimethylbenzimidazole phosphoribosyltransferase n=1 Tax=Reichenbachiella sp. 5M10 TaxID=1889772 RepID=UPI000C152035|nr:nicotinate-nucleotide--dimethylbenzimidazole phosphoribosyltransferase [Reichenbachiella sp. 5M10]PIB35669.1 nicotinate-nucleotide--dimethylbenzimidazole phosphoribosyltransferase [Reichenbachiella sp. 5M10]
MKKFQISAPDQSLAARIQHKIDFKTKPVGSLGQLERIGKKIALIQQSLAPQLQAPSMLVFAGDHGLTEEGISAFPPEVTHQMVLNFLSGGAAINVFCLQHDIHLQVIDAGVNHTFPYHPDLIDRKIAFGTANSLHQEAITTEELDQALSAGSKLVEGRYRTGCNIMGFGEMGIGNTSAASLLMAAFTDYPLSECIGKGTGVDSAGLQHKTKVIHQVFEKHQPKIHDPLHFFRSVAGLEMAMMLGAMLQAAEYRMTLLIDGFIASSVYLTACQLYPEISGYALCCHQSNEQGHQKLLDHLGQETILQLNMRLGEGTGCALAYPIVASSVAFLQDMASFESASISQKS